MKKIRCFLILILLSCLIPAANALGWTGTVTASSLNMRKSNSTDSKVVQTLRKGTKVEVMSTSGSWYKVKANGKTGYVAKSYISKSSSASSKSSSSKSSSGSSKSSSGSSKKSKGSSKKSGDPCSPGDTGEAVRFVQKKLKNLGYYSGSVDGDYGNGTKSAVKAFQRRNGLTANGVANSKTISKLKSSGAKKASSSSGGGGSSGIQTESLNWFKHPNTIPHHATFQVKDVKTGKVFTVKRWTGANHADCEPASAKDTKIMKSIYGHWSWKRRPVLVKYNGHVYAGSMNGMPHGTQTIKNNNFDGHFCIHFTGSKTHGSKKVDSQHQNCVKTALKHSW